MGLTHRAFYCVSRPPVPLPVSSVFRVVPMCVSCQCSQVCLVSMFTRSTGTDGTGSTEGHRVSAFPYCDLAHHLESRVRAGCRVVASSGLQSHHARRLYWKTMQDLRASEICSSGSVAWSLSRALAQVRFLGVLRGSRQQNGNYVLVQSRPLPYPSGSDGCLEDVLASRAEACDSI